MIETDLAMQLRGIHQKIIQIMQAKVCQYDLTFGLLNILMRIEKNPQANQKQLARDLNFTQGAMSIAVKRLLKAGMLKQISLESDMRYKKLQLTDKGKSMIKDYREHLSDRYESIFQGFNEGELKDLYSFLLKINTNLDNIDKDFQID